MSDNGQNGHANNGVGSEGSGGLGGAADDLLDGRTGQRDARLLRMALERRWKIPAETRQKAVEQAIRLSQHADDARAAKAGLDILVRMEAQNQTDQHLEAKYGRIDAGLPTDACVAFDLQFDEGTVERG